MLLLQDEELAPRLLSAVNGVCKRVKEMLDQFRASGPEFTDAEREEAHFLIEHLEEIAAYQRPS